MNTELLNQALADLLTNLSSAKGFVLDQIPEVAKECLNIAILEGCVGVIAASTLIYFCWRVHLGIQSDMEKGRYSVADIAYIPIGIVFLASLVWLSFSADQALTALVAPRVYLLKEFSSLAHGCK